MISRRDFLRQMALTVSARAHHRSIALVVVDAHAGFIASLLLPLMRVLISSCCCFCSGCSLMLASLHHCPVVDACGDFVAL